VQKGSGMLTKLNPTTWFKKKPKPVTTTELPVVRPTIEPGASNPVADSNLAEKEANRSTPIPRYRYRLPNKPAEGKRSDAAPYFAQGVKAQREQRLAAAMTAYRQAIKLDPSFFEANYNLALASREAGDLSSTLNSYEQALAIVPDSINARYNFAFTLQEMGYFRDAANELEKVLRQNPNETRAHLLLGNLYAQRLDQVATARDHYLKVLETEPQHPQATQIRYWLAAHP
jgi:tetratricopeptide (TPR) repeat protein